MPVYLSPEARLRMCRLIADRIKRRNLKLYATLNRVGLKGPAFYAYVEGRSTPSEDVVPRIVRLALTLDYDATVKIIMEDLEGLTKLVDRLMGLTSASISTVDQILGELLGPGRKRARAER